MKLGLLSYDLFATARRCNMAESGLTTPGFPANQPAVIWLNSWGFGVKILATPSRFCLASQLDLVHCLPFRQCRQVIQSARRAKLIGVDRLIRECMRACRRPDSRLR